MKESSTVKLSVPTYFLENLVPSLFNTIEKQKEMIGQLSADLQRAKVNSAPATETEYTVAKPKAKKKTNVVAGNFVTRRGPAKSLGHLFGQGLRRLKNREAKLKAIKIRDQRGFADAVKFIRAWKQAHAGK